jgi:hypothetical protein
MSLGKRNHEKTHSARQEQGDPDREPLAGPDEQDAALPLGPMREAVVDLQGQEEDETVRADRAAAEQRSRLQGDD